jgi:hypothetical protein
MRGWTWIHLRGVNVEYMEEDMGYAYDEEDLFKAFHANPCFANVAMPVPPYWQGNPLNFKIATSMVIAAILDKDNLICQCVSREGVCMFGRQIKFIWVGDHPSLIQCARCHKIGHNALSPRCGVPRSECHCYICGKAHNSQHHSFKCLGPHKVPGTCDCVLKCLLCKQSGHTSRDKSCPCCGDFAPPCLPMAALVEVRPPMEDAVKVGAIPHTRQACPVKGGGGSKAKGKGKQGDAPLFPQEDCPNSNGETPLLLCFCCPMMELAHYQQFYVGKEFTSSSAPKTSSSKDII